MNRNSFRRFVAVAALSMACALSSHAPAAPFADAEAPRHADTLIRNARIVDVERAQVASGQAIVIRGGDIVAVGADQELAAVWKATRTIDAGERYVVPGLWDMHVHFGGGPDLIEENEALFPLYIAHGVTTVRDASGDLPDQVLAWRKEIADGRLLGPNLFTSGAKIEGLKPFWKGTLEVGTRAEVDAVLDRLQRQDQVDFIKITDSTLDPCLFLYAVSQARLRGMQTSGHIPLALTVRQAIEAGLSSIEHLDYAFNAGVRDESTIAAEFAVGRITRAQANARLAGGFDRTEAMSAYRRMAELKVAVTPTLNGSRIIAFLDRESHADDAYLAYIGPRLRRTYEWRVARAASASAEDIAARHAHFEEMAGVLPMLQAAGVSIMAGTDAGFLNSYNYPGQGLHDELELYVKLGLTPAEALVSATRAGPAWLSKLGRFGAVAPGKAADLLLVERDPLQDIRALREIHAVVLRGQVHDRASLDAMLAGVRARVKTWNEEQGAK